MSFIRSRNVPPFSPHILSWPTSLPIFPEPQWLPTPSVSLFLLMFLWFTLHVSFWTVFQFTTFFF